MKASVCVSTFRPGGLDITLAGMRDQKFKDFELIICDHRYEKRHSEVMDLANKYGVKCIHVPEHRRNGKWTTFCSAWNTAFALARGEYIVILQDYCYCHPEWLESHLEYHSQRENLYLIGPYLHTDLPKLKTLKDYDFHNESPVIEGGILPEMFIFQDGPFDPLVIPSLEVHGQDRIQDCRRQMSGNTSGVKAPSWIHVKNESMRRDTLWSLGGLDERLERGKGPMDTDFAIRIEGLGLSLWWEPGMKDPIVPNPRWICGTLPWGSMEERVEGRWSFRDGINYNEMRRNEIRVSSDRQKACRARNDYAMGELASRLDPWREEQNHPVQSIDISDLEYWGREIWPESP
jgi:hypothetical protein